MKKHIYLLLFCWFWGLACYAQTPQKITYTYDALNRLTQVTYLNGSGISYNYDVLGNRNSVVIVGSCAVATATLSGTQTITAGQSATLSVALTGASPWSLVVNGITYSATVSPYTFSISPNVNTTYNISSVSNICGAGTVSGSAVVTVNACTQMYTLKTGNWNDVMVWSCGRLPTSTDIITVKLNHIITIPTTYIANAKSIVYEATGKINNANRLCLSCP
jgi:hypothetical protein